MATSYRFESPVYLKPLSISPTPKIAPENIKSMEREYTPSPTSYGYGNNFAYTIKDNSLFLKTANRLERYPLEDVFGVGNVKGWGLPVAQYWEESANAMNSWYSAANNNPPNSNEWIPTISDIARSKAVEGVSYITGITPLRLFIPNRRDTDVDLYTTPRIVEAVDINSLGKFASKEENLRQTLRSITVNSPHSHYAEAADWIDFLAKKGITIDKSPNIGVIGLGVETGDYIAAYYPGEKGFLVREYDFHNKAKNLISRYGLTEGEAVEAMKRSVLLHEFGHVLGIKGDRKSEHLQGILQAEFYSMMAAKYSGTKLERIYRALAREGQDYAKAYSLSQHVWDFIAGDSDDRGTLSYLIRKFWVEGLEMGKTGQELIDYVEERKQNAIGPLLGGEPSYRNSKKSNSKSKNNKSSRANKKDLEEIILDESNSVSFTIDENGKLAPTYEGKRVYGEGASMPTKFVGKEIGYEESSSENTYERLIGKSEYKSMNDAKKAAKEEKEAKAEKVEATAEAAE